MYSGVQTLCGRMQTGSQDDVVHGFNGVSIGTCICEGRWAFTEKQLILDSRKTMHDTTCLGGMKEINGVEEAENSFQVGAVGIVHQPRFRMSFTKDFVQSLPNFEIWHVD